MPTLNAKKSFRALLAYSHFFTSITFPGITPVEHIPWYLINPKVYLTQFLHVLSLLIVLLSSMLLIKQQVEVMTAAKYMLYFLASFVPFFYSKDMVFLLRNIATKMFYIFASLGILQALGVIDVLAPALDMLISRYSDNVLQESYRGENLIETEPARAAYLLLMTYLIAYWGRFGIWNLLLVTFVIFALVRSVTGIVLLSGVLSIYYASLKRLYTIVFYIAVGGLLLTAYVSQFPESKLAKSMVIIAEFSGSDFVYYLSSVSGGRLSATTDALYDFLVNNMMMPNIEDSYVNPEIEERAIYGGYGFSNTVPVSFISYHIRVLGFLFCILIFYVMNRHLKAKQVSLFISSRAFFVLLFIGLLYSPPGSPFYALLFMTILHHAKNEGKLV